MTLKNRYFQELLRTQNFLPEAMVGATRGRAFVGVMPVRRYPSSLW